LQIIHRTVWDDTVGSAIDWDAEGTAQQIPLCESQPAIKNAVWLKLSPAGFTVDWARTVQAALARSNANRYAAKVVGLPLHDDGLFDIVVQIRELPRHSSPLILIGSDDPESGLADARSHGVGVGPVAAHSRPLR
jgi:DNA-binding response OmpR family regulator